MTHPKFTTDFGPVRNVHHIKNGALHKYREHSRCGYSHGTLLKNLEYWFENSDECFCKHETPDNINYYVRGSSGIRTLFIVRDDTILAVRVISQETFENNYFFVDEEVKAG